MTEMSSYEDETAEIERDARSERRLVWQAVVAAVVVVAVVVLRELFLR